MSYIAGQPISAEALQTRIDGAGFGRFQIVMLLMTGGVMFAEGSEMLVMGSITTLLHDHWELNAFIRGAMVSIVFCGFSVGNLLSGYIGDSHGRKPSILLAYVMIGVFGLLTATAWTPTMMIILRFFVGVGCGIGFPSVYSLIPEVCPTQWRGIVSALMIGFMPLGEIFAAILVWIIDPNLDHSSHHCEVGYDWALEGYLECSWRTLCIYSALPAFFFFGFALFLLSESPHFLGARGKNEATTEVIERIERWNGVTPGGPVSGGAAPAADASESLVPKASSSSAIEIMTNGKYLRTTIFMCLAHFTKDFCVFGLAYVFPQFFTQQKSQSTAVHLLITGLLALPGVFIAVGIMNYEGIGNIVALRVTAGCASLVALGLLEGSPTVLAVPCAYGLKFLSLVFFIITVIYTAEVFPSKFRNTAVGICTAIGRVGSISAPLLFELSLDWSDGSFDFFISMVAILMATICLTAGFMLTIETKGKALAMDGGNYGSTEKA